jgi:AhpD family alkylhydroperoxidase
MPLENRTKALIAVGASLSANCRQCLEFTLALALESGASDREITEAFDIGKRVRQGAASRMDIFDASLNGAAELSATPSRDECGCN